MDCWPDWSGICQDILIEIALHLTLYEDLTAFRGVCTNWRAAGSAKAMLFKGSGRVPVLMLAEKDEREFYSLSKGKIFMRAAVPEAKGKRCIDAGFGWILTLSDACQGCEVSLFSPLCSAAKIEVPHTLTFPGYKRCYTCPESSFVTRALLSANPSLTSNFTVFVGVNDYLGFWKNGDKSWTRLNMIGSVENMAFYKEKMYVVSENGFLFSWDPNGTGRTRVEMIPSRRTVVMESTAHGMSYLVESSDGELLIIFRNKWRFCTKCHIGIKPHFGVVRVDFVKMDYEKTKGIGKDAVFLGHNSPVAVVAADFPGVLRPNCIYFTDDWWYFCTECGRGNGKDMGVYNLQDKSIQRFDVESFSQICPPLWIFPSF